MNTSTASITGNWNDPDVPEKAMAFFLELHREIREKQLSRPVPPANKGGAQTILGLDNLPKEYLPSDSFKELLRIRRTIHDVTERPLVETDDARTAAHDLIRRAILCEANRFITAILFYLAFDHRFHSNRNYDARATGLLGFGNDETEQAAHYDRVRDLFACTALCNLTWPPARPKPEFDEPLAILRNCGDIFFVVLQSVFPICEIGKCHMAFLTFCQNLGVHTDEDIVARYVQCRKTMQRAIEAYEAHEEKPVPAPATPAIEQKIDAIVRTVANMDRRQKTLFDFIKKTITGFVTLFRPRASVPAPSREAVAAHLSPPSRYACLARTQDPHRSQLKAVIDYTVAHPIVHRSKKKNDFTLSHAARAVWNRDHAKWEKAPGSYETFECLKAACYGLQDKSDDPFCYQ